jgi:hypothetical protein
MNEPDRQHRVNDLQFAAPRPIATREQRGAAVASIDDGAERGAQRTAGHLCPAPPAGVPSFGGQRYQLFSAQTRSVGYILNGFSFSLSLYRFTYSKS